MRPIIAYADGSSRGNPGPGGWGSIVLSPQDEVVELGGAGGHTTNNRMEMMAAIEVLELAKAMPGRLEIRTDSSYLIQGVTKWIFAWRKRGWRTVDGNDVLNRDLWETLARLVAERGSAHRIQWVHVPGHAGEPGNERVDTIATSFAKGEVPDLYRGPLASYSVRVPLGPAPPSSSVPGPSRSSAPRKAYSYLSLVGGEARRHATWGECEKRVKGVPGAKFKKSQSPADEANILREWGVDRITV